LAARLSPPEGADGDAAAPAPVESKPVPALRLLMIAIWRWFKGLFRRGKS
jgi:hypothetical protein